MTSCWVIYNGSLVSDKFADQARLVAEAAERAGITAKIMKNYETVMDLSVNLSIPDFAILLDKDILLGYFLKSRGVPVYNDPAVIDVCDNKATQYVQLAAQNLPMPRTIVAPKVYPNFSILDSGYFEEVIHRLQLPMIIKKWKPVVVGDLPDGAMKIVRETADRLHAELICPAQTLDIALKLKGPHQQHNATLALEAAKELLGLDFSEAKARDGLESAELSYRFERVYPGVIFDGAHNTASIAALVATIKETFPERQVHIVMGIFKDKDYQSILRQLETVSDHFTFVDFENERALPARILFEESKSKRKTITNLCDILPVSDKEEETIVTGSLHLLVLLRNSANSFFQHYQA